MNVSSETFAAIAMAYRPGKTSEYRVPSRGEPAGTEFGLCTERARQARKSSIKINAVAGGHGRSGGIVNVLLCGASHVRCRSRSTFSRLS